MKKKILILATMVLAMAMTILATDSQAADNSTAMFLGEDNVALAEGGGSCVSNTWTLCWKSNGTYQYSKKWQSS